MDNSADLFDEDEADEICLRALQQGLPALPDVIHKGQSFPVARWIGPKIGAVLRVEWKWDPINPQEDGLASIVQTYQRLGNGWEQSPGNGGSGWFNPPFSRPAMKPTQVNLWGMSISGNNGSKCCALYGVVGSATTKVELLSDDLVISAAVESSIGAVVVGTDAAIPALVRMISSDGSEISSVQYDPTEHWVV